MLMTLIPLFDENMVVRAYSLFTQKTNVFLNTRKLGTGEYDGVGRVEGFEMINSIIRKDFLSMIYRLLMSA